MKIYTKTGDKGTSIMMGGTILSKSDIKIEACGNIDELNAWIGLLADYTINEHHVPVLREISTMLFNIGANVMVDGESTFAKMPPLYDEDITMLENEIDKMNEKLQPIRNFILPGGHKEVSFAHIARTVCRRAERTVVKMAESQEVEDHIIKYLNRLSDYLFTLCREMSLNLGVEEIAWCPRKKL